MKVALLLSGGVDSSVALKLLLEQGYEVEAFYLKIWLEDELAFLGECPWEEDLSFCRKICDQLKVKLNVINMQKEYFDQVVSYTIKEVKEGRTPNPDIFCNKLIKFGLFFDKLTQNFEKVASGHYAQIVKKDSYFYLKEAPDSVKDQTYFLAMLNQSQLSKCIFPIGEYSKDEVREMAVKFNLANKNRKDSQGICFLGKLKFEEFLKHYLGEQAGDIIEFESQKKLGEHQGFWYYTIGQRRNIRLPDGPWFVVKKDSENNKIFVSKNYHSDDKERNQFKISNFNFFNGKLPLNDSNLSVKIRHGEKKYNCKLRKIDEAKAEVTISENDQGIAPGQFAVFYDGGLCLGAAKIVK